MATLLYWLRIFQAAALTGIVYIVTIVGYTLAVVIPIAVVGGLGIVILNWRIWKRHK